MAQARNVPIWSTAKVEVLAFIATVNDEESRTETPGLWFKRVHDCHATLSDIVGHSMS